MLAVRALAAMNVAATLAGCSSAPSYYTERMSPAYAAPSAYEEPRRAPARRTARRAGPQQIARREAVVRDNTGSTAEATPPPAGASRGASLYESPEHEAREMRRERSLKRSINSICSGC